MKTILEDGALMCFLQSTCPGKPFNDVQCLGYIMLYMVLFSFCLLVFMSQSGLPQAAEEGKMDPLVGRSAELERTIQILARRQKNNPVPRVGKACGGVMGCRMLEKETG